MNYEQEYQALYDALKAQGWKIYKAYPHGEAELDYYACRTPKYRDWETDRKSTRLNSSHSAKSRMPSSA